MTLAPVGGGKRSHSKGKKLTPPLAILPQTMQALAALRRGRRWATAAAVASGCCRHREVGTNCLRYGLCRRLNR